jgi:hypothetical protein
MRRTLTLALVFTLATTAHAATDVIRKGFNVADGGTLHLDAGVGSIKIVTGGSGVAFEVTRKYTDDDVLQEHKITFSQQGNDVIVDSDIAHTWSNWWRRYEVQWNIRVPANYNLDVKTSGGSIDLADIGGTTEARTSGGSIKTGNLTGPDLRRLDLDRRRPRQHRCRNVRRLDHDRQHGRHDRSPYLGWLDHDRPRER